VYCKKDKVLGGHSELYGMEELAKSTSESAIAPSWLFWHLSGMATIPARKVHLLIFCNYSG
jgi:hypothetical protein